MILRTAFIPLAAMLFLSAGAAAEDGIGRPSIAHLSLLRQPGDIVVPNVKGPPVHGRDRLMGGRKFRVRNVAVRASKRYLITHDLQPI
jgi:hypothetical protein